MSRRLNQKGILDLGEFRIVIRLIDWDVKLEIQISTAQDTRFKRLYVTH